MGQVAWASGRWQVKDGEVDTFIDRWKDWLGWTSQSVQGFRSATLLQAKDEPRRFTSLSDWDDDASLQAWKQSPAFAEKFAAVRDLCDDVVAGDFEVSASFAGPSASEG
jgi:heme-degrading monooxygenase HmoA